MTTAIHTPLDFSKAEPGGFRKFWKQILPVTSIDYDGQQVDFDPEFHKSLNLSFHEGAYEQVPVVFADSENRHNMDPRNFGGEIVDVEYRGPGEGEGTWALIKADRQAAKAIKANPKLGVSARILRQYENGGKVFTNAMNHLLLTMNPRVRGMQPWQAADLSEDADIEVVDLTDSDYEEGNAMGTRTTRRRKASKTTIDLSKLTDEQFQDLLDLAGTDDEDPEDDDLTDEERDALDDEDDEGEGDQQPERRTRRKKSKTKITVEKDSEDDGEDDDEDENPDGVELSESDKRVRLMELNLAEERWDRTSRELIRKGVPPYMVDLAAPVLSLPESQTLDLAEGKSLDNPAAIIRRLLDSSAGLVDLSEERGHMVDLSDALNKEDPDAEALAAWNSEYPIH